MWVGSEIYRLSWKTLTSKQTMPVYSPGYILNHLRRRSSVWIFAFFHIILKKSWRKFSKPSPWPLSGMHLAIFGGTGGSFTPAETLWTQNCRTSIHPRRTKNKSYSQRKKPFLKGVDLLPVQTRLRHSHDVH